MGMKMERTQRRVDLVEGKSDEHLGSSGSPARSGLRFRPPESH
jgi:hypothetical protein